MRIVKNILIFNQLSNNMESESEFGNIEYKRTISHIDVGKLISYAAQMKYRVRQSIKNIAYYYIGINDDGTIYGLDDTDVNIIEIFKKTCKINKQILFRILNKRYIK